MTPTTESACDVLAEHPPSRSAIPTSGVAAYTSALLANVLAAIARSLLLLIPLGILGLILGWHPALAHPLALAIAFLPLGWSLCGLIIPAEGWLIEQDHGGRPPSARERQRYEEALGEILARDPDVRLPKSWCVVDQADFPAAVMGDTLILARVTLHELALEPILAHELGHLQHHDGRITIALLRLAPFASQLEGRPRGPGIFAALARVVVYVASGGLSMRLTTLIWAGYFRCCEYRADEFAARLGYAGELIDYFEGAVAYDQPVPFAWMKAHTEPRSNCASTASPPT